MYGNTVCHSRQNSPFIIHIAGSLITSGHIQPTVCVAHKFSLSWNKSSVRQSVVDVSVSRVLLTHMRPNYLTRPQRSLLIPKQSLRVWACEESCWDDLRLSVGWAWFDSDIRGFPISAGLRWELFKDPAVDLASGLGEVCELQSGFAVDFDADISVNVCSSQYITVDLSASGGLVTTWITGGFSSSGVLFLQRRGRQSTGDKESSWGAGRSVRSTSVMTPTQAVSWPPSRCPLIPTVKKPARWERTQLILWFMIRDATYLNCSVLFLIQTLLSVGGECSGVWDSAAEEPASRADCAVLWLSPGPWTEETHHFCWVHAWGAYSAGHFIWIYLNFYKSHVLQRRGNSP